LFPKKLSLPIVKRDPGLGDLVSAISPQLAVPILPLEADWQALIKLSTKECKEDSCFVREKL
jgi:hypothetical protein